MGSVICVANQKGGVGKTTTCVNLAASLAATQRRVLLIDLDPQSNATMGCGIDKNALEYTVCDVLLDDIPVADILQAAPEGGFTVLPSNQELTSAEVELVQKPDREFRLRKALEPVAARFDYILIDCPPALNMLTVNALTAADFVLIPMQCEYFALEGLTALVGTIDRIRATSNPKLTIHGILRTMFDPRNNLANEVSAQLSAHFGDRVYNTVIPRNVRLAEAPSHGLPAVTYDARSRGAEAYFAFAREVLARNTEVASIQ
jgi:chromosome partitioning protein